jgi:hypothetical protein
MLGALESNRAVAAMAAAFPDYQIWPEVTGDRVRYVARTRRRGVHPHTVVTADLAELRRELGQPDQLGASTTNDDAGRPTSAPGRPAA